MTTDDATKPAAICQRDIERSAQARSSIDQRSQRDRRRLSAGEGRVKKGRVKNGCMKNGCMKNGCMKNGFVCVAARVHAPPSYMTRAARAARYLSV